MKFWLGLVVLCACSAGDDTATGSHANCAEGGAINQCDGAVSTARDACWKLVDCGAISINSGDTDKHFDWGACVDRIETSIDTEQQLIVSCIAASSCDALKVQNSPDNPNPNAIACLRLGGQR